MGGVSLRYWRVVLSILGVCGLAQGITSAPSLQTKRIVIAASLVLDGKGGVLHDSRIVVEDSKSDFRHLCTAVHERAGT